MNQGLGRTSVGTPITTATLTDASGTTTQNRQPSGRNASSDGRGRRSGDVVVFTSPALSCRGGPHAFELRLAPCRPSAAQRVDHAKEAVAPEADDYDRVLVKVHLDAAPGGSAPASEGTIGETDPRQDGMPAQHVTVETAWRGAGQVSELYSLAPGDAGQGSLVNAEATGGAPSVGAADEPGVRIAPDSNSSRPSRVQRAAARQLAL